MEQIVKSNNSKRKITSFRAIEIQYNENGMSKAELLVEKE